MRKVIASINMTLDGYCNHTASTPSDELHEYFNDLIKNGGIILWGRITYGLMEEAFPALVKKPGGDKPLDKFALLIDEMPKLVFSKTLTGVTWHNTTLAQADLIEEVLSLKQQPGKDILIGSPSLIAQLTQHDLIDEYRLCVHPIILGSGLVLFKNISNQINLQLTETKTFQSGVVVLYYQKLKQSS